MAKKALIAMSGGVDSSVAAKLMLEKGYECTGCTMKLYKNEDAGTDENAEEAKGHTCCSLDDVEDARAVCYSLGMRHIVLNMRDDFIGRIIEKFAASYERGVTPNPCIDCNRYIKFNALYQRAQELGFDYVVTGHYARIAYENGQYYLKKGLDEQKDQSYVLYDFTQERLAHTLFPMGEFSKEETRRIARENGFVNAAKPDSQDICFVPDGDYASVIERFTGRKSLPGNFVDAQGNVLGRHKGIIHYTIGQRKGLGIAFGEPMFVIRIDPERNEVVLGRTEELMGTSLISRDFHWISGITPDAPLRCKAKVRYRQKETEVTVTPTGETSISAVFDMPQRAITKGQAVVLYDGETVLGGGTIG